MQCFCQLLGCHFVEVEDDGSAEVAHTVKIIRLIAKHRQADQRHAVKHSFVQTVSAAMSHECSCLRVTWGGEINKTVTVKEPNKYFWKCWKKIGRVRLFFWNHTELNQGEKVRFDWRSALKLKFKFCYLNFFFLKMCFRKQMNYFVVGVYQEEEAGHRLMFDNL